MKLGFLIILTLLHCELSAQRGYSVHEETGDFAIKKILNYSSTSASFGQFKKRLLILDFFGTWCAPCIKAIPHLEALQKSFKDQITIILVSEETQDKLENFLQKRKPFSFPLIVDEEKKFIDLFQPPSYPYTVIIGKNNKVLAIPSPEDLTENNINKWLNEQDMPGTSAIHIMQTAPDTSNAMNENNSNRPAEPENKLMKLSQDFSYAAKTGEGTSDFIAGLRELNFNELKDGLKTDSDKKAFWINLYNAYTQVALRADPGQYQKRGKFFGSKKLEIAGKKFSLDDIEHGILRRSKIKWSLGHLNKLFPGRTEKLLRVKKLDYRLHFALNCGAKSCPPVAFYQSATIDKQLDLATRAYLTSEAEYDEKADIVKLPKIMSWFRADFGGKKKMITLLKSLSIIPEDRNPKIQFKDYDWTLYLQNYKL